jgi:hypothetical protein
MHYWPARRLLNQSRSKHQPVLAALSIALLAPPFAR